MWRPVVSFELVDVPFQGITARSRWVWSTNDCDDVISLDWWRYIVFLGVGASRLDLIDMGVRTNLAPKVGEKRTYLPPACYTLNKEEKQAVCNSLANVKVPEGYSSNISSLVDMKNLCLVGLKSHDHHTLLQHIIPISIRSVLPKKVRNAITRFCLFFKSICCKVVDVSKLDNLESEIIYTLCLLEQFFPPSFFDIMVHLTVHLVREV